MTKNQNDLRNIIETERHNRMMEQETSRHQLATEDLTRTANLLQAEMNRVTSEHYQRQDSINQQHYERQDAINKAHYERSDAETTRSNLAQEAWRSRTALETERSNAEQESIKRRQIAIDAAELSEQNRHSKAMESIERSLNESVSAKNYAQISEISANAGLIQARTRTEGTQQALNSSSTSRNYAETALKQQQTTTEAVKRDESRARTQGIKAEAQLRGAQMGKISVDAFNQTFTNVLGALGVSVR